jgi:hypothetical protein
MKLPTLRHLRTLFVFLWRSTQRWVVILAGFALLLGGVALLVLPGPGLLVIIAGLVLLAREFVWAERALDEAKRRAASGAQRVRRFSLRRRAEPAPEAPGPDAV